MLCGIRTDKAIRICSALLRQSYKEVRGISSSVEEYAQDIIQPAPKTFQDLGLRPAVVAALYKAFPHIQRPTEAQTRFIPAVLSGRDVLLKDETGSGKTFGLMLALLSKNRLRFTDRTSGGFKAKPSITSLMIVPHRDLAYQVLHWVQCIATAHKMEEIDSTAQALVRDKDLHITSGLHKLQDNPPHLLIATPQAILDILNVDADAIPRDELSSVVLDEADYLVETIPTSDFRHKWKEANLRKAQRRIDKHPGATRAVLDNILQERIRIYDSTSLLKEPPHLAQFIACSATLSGHLRDYLLSDSSWVDPETVVPVIGTNSSPSAPSDTKHSFKPPTSTHVQHSVLVLSDHGARNVHYADEAEDDEDIPSQTDSEQSSIPAYVIDAELRAKYDQKPSPFNPQALEAVAMAFAIDVPSIALLVIPPSTSVTRAIYDLQQLSVNAHGLNMLVEEQGRGYLLNKDVHTITQTPTLLVATPAMIRGIDLPDLTHIFMLGIPGGKTGGRRNADEYLHVAGRVGRTGRGGRVVTILEPDEDATGEEEEMAWESKDSSRMKNILRRVGATAVQYKLFD